VTPRHARDEVNIRQLIDELAESIRTTDFEGLKACFVSDIVSFDVGPRLLDLGSQTKLKNWEEAFAVLQPPLEYEIRNLEVTVGDDVAFAHGINRLSGMLNGERFGAWVRWTACFQKIDDKWLIAHDHVSLPVDPMGSRAMLNLEPDGSTA
jgi:ketosteroid isomerase-like protein